MNMLSDLKGREVTVSLELSPWGNSVVNGEVLEVSDDWIKIQSKNTVELIAASSVKKVACKL